MIAKCLDRVPQLGDAASCRRFGLENRRTPFAFAERLQRSRVILVSHNMDLIRKMCDAVVLLEAGQATFHSDVEQGIAAYEAAGERQ